MKLFKTRKHHQKISANATTTENEITNDRKTKKTVKVLQAVTAASGIIVGCCELKEHINDLRRGNY